MTFRIKIWRIYIRLRFIQFFKSYHLSWLTLYLCDFYLLIVYDLFHINSPWIYPYCYHIESHSRLMKCFPNFFRYATILAFDVKVERDAQELADSLGVKIFQADIIYHLFDKFTAYREELKQKKRDEFRSIAVFPCKMKVCKIHQFNQIRFVCSSRTCEHSCKPRGRAERIRTWIWENVKWMKMDALPSSLKHTGDNWRLLIFISFDFIKSSELSFELRIG